ncbi:MAG: molybdopterin cofactor-binding domain-containing protein [Bacteroidota bacterium]
MSNEQKPKSKSRRKFLVRSAIGLGVIIGGGALGLSPMRRFLAIAVDEADLAYSNDAGVNLWFEVLADNRILFHCPKIEMGQGAFTGLAQLAAEELKVPISMIEVVNSSTAKGPVDGFSTGGSNSISGLWVVLRELAATMREMLKNGAADIMGVNATSLQAKDGVISGNGKTMSYGEVVQQVTEWKEPEETPTLTQRQDWQLIGKPIPRVDLKPKVMGDPIFGMDATMPGMLYGSVARPTQVDVSFQGVENAAEVEKMPGVVKVVVTEDFAGVVAESKTAADLAKEALKINWKVNKVWQQAEIEEMIKVGSGKAFVIQKEGRAKRLLEEEGAEIMEAEYFSPMAAHAQIEPNGALAYVEADKATIMMATQVVGITRKEVADSLGFKEDQVELIPMYAGGGFGRRLHTPNAMQAAALSKAVGKPVHCFFSRKEEFQNDTFRPPTHHVLRGRLSADGKIEAFEHQVSSGDVAFGSALLPRALTAVAGADFGAWRGGLNQYKAIPNYRTVSWRVKLPFATSWWRSLGLLANTFAIESFLDEMAHKAGEDPVQFRLDHIADDERSRRLRAVIEATAEKGEWGKPMPEGRAQGFAASTDANTPAAHVVEVSIEKGEIKVHKVTCAIDPGIAINPDGIRAQSEGAIIMGLGASLFEKMEIKDGVIGPTIYGAYKMARMKHAPKEIDIIILENGSKPSGVGEPPLGPIGAAIGNAVFKLTGQRLRSMPMELS